MTKYDMVPKLYAKAHTVKEITSQPKNTFICGIRMSKTQISGDRCKGIRRSEQIRDM